MFSGGKSKTRKCSICKHFVAQIAHQIDRQSHNSSVLHELCMLMDVRVWEKRVNPVNFNFFSCKHFGAQISHQIDKQSHNSGILHD